jgi:hypothetical protein
MKTNFEDPLKFTADGNKLMACGPIDWNDLAGPEADEICVTATVIQGNVVAQGQSEPCGRSVAEWEVDLKAGAHEKFQKGPAHAMGTATVTNPQNGQSFSWQASVQLSP